MNNSITKFLNGQKKHSSLEKKQRKFGYLFTLPFIIGVSIFVVYPIILSIIYSFNKVTYNSDVNKLVYDYLGLGNFNYIWLEDVNFRKYVLKSLSDMIFNVPVVVIFSFFMASVLNTKFVGRGFARSVMFLPVIIASGIIVGLSANMASSLISAGDRFASTAGDTFQVTTAFQTMLEEMNLSQWLVDFVVGAVSRISDIVSMSAVSIVVFMAGLQSISPSIYEASYMEGATKWEVFWKISLPMVSPLILLSIVYTIIDAFNGQNNTVISTIHTQVVKTEFGIGSAMAISYSLIIVVILLAVFGILSRVIFYED